MTEVTEVTVLPLWGVCARARARIRWIEAKPSLLSLPSRFKELCADLVDHLGDDPTAPQFAIIRRAAALSVWCEQAEADQAQGATWT